MKVKLSDAFDLQMGKTPPRNDRECWGEGHKWISISDIGSTGKYIDATKEEITDAGVSKSGIKVVPKGTVIMSFKLSIGKTAITAEDMYTNEAIMAFINKGRYEINTDYLYHMCKGIDWLAGTNKAVLGLTLNKATMSEKEIVIPSMAEQLHVVSVLDKMDELIALRKEQLAKLDQLVKSRFIELFDVQKCQKKTLGECTDFVDYRGHTPELSDAGTIRMVNAKSVGKGFFKYVDEYVTEETYDSWMHRGFGYPGDILFVTEGHTFGNTCLIPNDLKKFALGQRVITIKGHQEVLNAFLCSYMQTDMFWKDINVYRTGGTAQGIRSKDLVKVYVPIPPLEQQKQFAAFVEQTDKSKLAIQQSLDKLELLKKSLMQEYFG